MNCANHPEKAASAYCRTCGKPLCADCQRPVAGTLFCEEHAPQPAAAGPAQQTYSPYTSPYTSTYDPHASPGLAFILGLIPGVGAIYNGQYAKGLVHVIILGLLISIVSSGAGGLEPLFGMMIPVWWIYMAFEAYHTASKRQRGEPVDEFSSVFPVRAGATGFPIGPLVLIGVGVLFLLHNLDMIRLYEVLRFWPVFLILLGVYMLYARFRESRAVAGSPPAALSEETPSER